MLDDKRIKKNKILFVGGVHGVGKTSFCKKVSEELNIDHYSASDLIKNVKNVKFPTNKHINEIGENQDSLVVAIDNNVNRETVCLLDGHFCLLDSHGKVVKVPMSTFLSISPITIIVLYDEPSNIYERIQTRDGKENGVDGIAKFQESEIKYSKLVSETLGTPYLLANPFIEDEASKDFIRNVI